MVSRICLLFCALALSSSVLAQDSMTLVERPQGIKNQMAQRGMQDQAAPKLLDKWEPIWVSGWSSGKHAIKLELVDKKGAVVDNGGYNSTTREISVVK